MYSPRYKVEVTEEYLNFMQEHAHKFWLEFSELCNKYLLEADKKFPSQAGYTAMLLSEKTSLYGRKTQ